MKGTFVAKVLVVDDDEGLAQRLTTTLSEADEINALVEFLTDFDEAEERLREEAFDLVVLDLMLGQGDHPEEQRGRILFDRISAARWVPVVFFSGRADLVEELAKPPSVQVVSKPDVEAVVQAVRTGLESTVTLITRQLADLVDVQTRAFLRDVVAQHWSEMEGADHDEFVLVLVNRLAAWLKEHAVTELQKRLTERNGFSVDHASAASVYLYPPVTDYLNSADLVVATDDQWWLVLTPACDLYEDPPGPGKRRTPSAEHVRIAPADPAIGHPGLGTDPNQWKSRLNTMLQKQNRYRYLPHFLDIPHLIVDMERATSRPYADVACWRRIATLDSPFAEAAITTFGQASGRVGHPDIDTQRLKRRLEEAISEAKAGHAQQGPEEAIQ